jgi:hypothetical protein
MYVFFFPSLFFFCLFLHFLFFVLVWCLLFCFQLVFSISQCFVFFCVVVFLLPASHRVFASYIISHHPIYISPHPSYYILSSSYHHFYSSSYFLVLYHHPSFYPPVLYLLPSSHRPYPISYLSNPSQSPNSTFPCPSNFLPVPFQPPSYTLPCPSCNPPPFPAMPSFAPTVANCAATIAGFWVNLRHLSGGRSPSTFLLVCFSAGVALTAVTAYGHGVSCNSSSFACFGLLSASV